MYYIYVIAIYLIRVFEFAKSENWCILESFTVYRRQNQRQYYGKHWHEETRVCLEIT